MGILKRFVIPKSKTRGFKAIHTQFTLTTGVIQVPPKIDI